MKDFITFTPNNGYDPNFPSSKRPACIEKLRAEIRGEKYKPAVITGQKLYEDNYTPGDIFSMKPADEWFIKGKRPEQLKMLFDNFWYESELCLLFADTNAGKSILAVQIGNSLASGGNVDGFLNQAPPTPVIYFDLEQDAAQFAARYSCYDGAFKFSDNFYRAGINTTLIGPRHPVERITEAIVSCIRKTGAKIVIIDNLTYLAAATGGAGDACSLLRSLKTMKHKYGLSILALAHTPKRDPSKPLTNNDMQGSKMLVNFCDSAFAIGMSQTEHGLRYLKQIKQRNAEQTYGDDHVCLMRIDRAGGLLRMVAAGHDAEGEHLLKKQFVPITDRRKIMKLHKEGHSYRNIAQQTGVSHTTVSRVIERDYPL